MKNPFVKLLCGMLCAGLVLTMALVRPVAVFAENGSGSTAAETITIGDTTFAFGADESSHWSGEKGWKNVPGQYVAMVDFDGSGQEVSADNGVLTLAVAGVNRIGTLKGNCSVRIAGTGIILLDRIEIEDGNTITLHPNTEIYEEGSAAVFLLQDDGSYLLINGGTTGILDEEYDLNNVRLTVPKDSALLIGATGVRTETWYEEGSEEPVKDVTYYTGDLPYNVNESQHNGFVDVEAYVGSVRLGANSTLTIEDGASVQLKKIKTGLSYIEGELFVKGVLDVEGTLEGGYVDVGDGASVNGNGTILSSGINLNAGGSLSTGLLLDKCGLSVLGEDRSFTPPPVKDSIIYLKGSRIAIPELNASGVSRIGVTTIGVTGGNYSKCEIGNITLGQESSLEIVCNEHSYAPYHEDLPRLVEDSFLTISGKITGGPVNVLGGFVEYTGTGAGIVPVVPDGYAARVLVTEVSSGTTLFPLNMTDEKASNMANENRIPDQIPVMRMTVSDTLVDVDILARKWVAEDVNQELDPLDRKEGNDYRSFTCASFLEAYGMTASASNYDSTYFTGVEVIKSDLSRRLYFLDDEEPFDTDDTILIRVLDCTGIGGQGGQAITHTETNFTGSGIIVGAGDGAVTTGSGRIIYGRNGQPTPTPTPTPTPVPTEPAEDSDAENQQYVQETAGQQSGPKTGGALTTEVTAQGNGRYTLSVYRNGAKLDDLNGYSVTVKIREPEGITENDICYAAFDTAGRNAWIPASYDPATKELVFETKQTGTFGLARVVVEELSYPAANADAPVFRRLSVWIGNEEITALPGPVEAFFAADASEQTGVYAVFADENEKLSVFPLTFDETEKGYRFETGVTGDFVVVKPENASGSSSDLYEACRRSDEVRVLITRMRLEAFWS